MMLLFVTAFYASSYDNKSHNNTFPTYFISDYIQKHVTTTSDGHVYHPELIVLG